MCVCVCVCVCARAKMSQKLLKIRSSCVIRDSLTHPRTQWPCHYVKKWKSRSVYSPHFFRIPVSENKLKINVSVCRFTSDMSLRLIGDPVARTQPMMLFTSSWCAWLQRLPSLKHPKAIRPVTSSKVFLPLQSFFSRERQLPSAASSSPACRTAPWQSSATEPIQLRPTLRSSIIHGQHSPWPQAAFVIDRRRGWGERGVSGEPGQMGESWWQGEKQKREERREQGEWVPNTSGLERSVRSGLLRGLSLSIKEEMFRFEVMGAEALRWWWTCIMSRSELSELLLGILASWGDVSACGPLTLKVTQTRQIKLGTILWSERSLVYSHQNKQTEHPSSRSIMADFLKFI